MPAIISFTSDFGTADHYVAAVKAVMLQTAPAAQIVDVSHAVPPQSILTAVYLTEQAWPYFPRGTVHLIVVDPGVGTDRAAVALQTPAGIFVGPDNGVLSAALPGQIRGAADDALEPRSLATTLLPRGFELRELSPRLKRPHAGSTFHGRDWFGPAAAALAAGQPFAACGPVRDSLWVLPRLEGRVEAGAAIGSIIHVDHFGNLISAIRREQLPPGASATHIAGRELPIVRTYGEAAGLVSLIGSGGYLEVALVNGSAAASLGVGCGEQVRVGPP